MYQDSTIVRFSSEDFINGPVKEQSDSFQR